MKTTILIIAASLFSGIVLAQEATVKARQSASLQVAPQAKASSEIKEVTKTTIKPAEASVKQNVKTNVKAATSSSIKAGNAIHSSVKAAPVKAAANVRTNVKVGLR